MRIPVSAGRSGWVWLLVLALGLAGCGEDAAQQAGGGQQQQPPLKAQVLELEPRDLPVDKQYSALLRSEQQVDVMARVTGVLQERQFDEGAHVEKGQSLFVIEPDRYQAVVSQRKADLESAEAELYRAQRNWERYQRLYQQNSVSQQQRDEARADLLAAQAAVAQAQAALNDAQLDLDYSTVEAPVAGQISLSEVNVGNLVQAPQMLATITPLKTLQARFSLPPEDAMAIRMQRRASDESRPITPVASSRGGLGDDRLSGELSFLGSRVDRDTGTVQAQATFDNPDALFLPGQFVRLTLDGLVLPDLLAVPEIAVTEGREGPQVSIVDADGKAKPLTVELGERSGAWIAIRSGLEAGQRVVVSNVPSAQPGRAIEAQPFDGKADSTPPPTQQQKQSQQQAQSARNGSQKSAREGASQAGGSQAGDNAEEAKG
ncbi:efflux RND transporter periplasmic adaptor subunit [Halomonas sp. HP20-15]|uniref:efflux RND transporter periplasmic adaptor subunit n=1 Tax=Halomonas sp. HP20-15 TaxID=3085901 RepID=UPI0029813C59|nr:efflux RND transporter periplasmic adaptor subunit [Halomonas sp. HP20-15]MDW5378293.1 efflux RND transporter periplasmic adaptor subunit [Halomonas sp. HP20-15]